MHTVRLAIVAMMVACSSSSKPGFEEELGTSYVGTWKFTGESCNGQPVINTGYAATLTLTETSGTNVLTANGCAATLSDYPLTKSGNSLTAAIPAASISCSPNPCILQWTARASDGSVGTASLRCPNDLPVSGSRVTYTIVDGDLQSSTDVGNGTTCTLSFVRVQ